MGLRIATSVLAVTANTVAWLVLVVGLFIGLFWTPGFILAASAFVLAADSRTLSQALDFRRRRDQVREAARPYRGGWLDSPARR